MKKDWKSGRWVKTVYAFARIRRDQPRPRAALAADPAVWRGHELVAAPLAGMALGWSAELGFGSGAGADDFFSALLSH